MSTRSKTCMHLKKFKLLPSFRKPEAHFTQAKRHQNASAITGSIYFFRSTIVTVYGAQHQKTVNTSLGKQTMWFSEVIKKFHHYIQEKQAGRDKKIKRKVALHSWSLSIDIKNSMAQNYKHFQRTHQITHQKKHREILMLPNKTFEQLLQISIDADMKPTRRGIIRKKLQDHPIRSQITFGIQLHTFPSKCDTRKVQYKN